MTGPDLEIFIAVVKSFPIFTEVYDSNKNDPRNAELIANTVFGGIQFKQLQEFLNSICLAAEYPDEVLEIFDASSVERLWPVWDVVGINDALRYGDNEANKEDVQQYCIAWTASL